VSDGADIRNQDQLNATVSFRLAGNPAVKTIELRLGEAGQVDGITQFSSAFTTKAVEQDGYTMGYMEAFEINDTGIITGIYSNGARNILGQVALANFTNPEGLTKAGQNNFVESINSGNAIIGVSGVQGLGGINAGFLEMSNVDLADQFTDMIVTQRGFQANSRSITTADQMLQELLGLKR
jgi:flagellar hook protein FlgE